jgi:predicted metal-dependent hydrolase
MSYDPRYLKGVEHFNKEEFFEAHEVWEDLWHDTHDDSREFVQGLIQVTSSLHHLCNGNMRGARLLHDSGLQLLERYGRLKAEFNEILRGILDAPLQDLPGRGHPGTVKISYDASKAPKINLT